MTSELIPIKAFLKRIKAQVGNPAVRVPKGLKWSIEKDPHGVVPVCVEIPASRLGRNMQEDVPSAPVFALCLAYWHEKATGVPARARVTVTGQPRNDGLGLLHWRRSQFILSEMSAILRDRFICQPPATWSWPKSPCVNREMGVRDAGDASAGGEHALEVAIRNSPRFLSSMRERCPDFKAFERQMPIGLFEGKPSKATHWTPGGKSQVDLWGTTSDGKTIHLVELKDQGNKKVGMLSEAFYYARLLHYVRVGMPGVGKIEGGGPSMDAVRAATRIVMWLSAPEYHPLVESGGNSPIEWLNSALVDDNMKFGMLRISPDKSRFIP